MANETYTFESYGLWGVETSYNPSTAATVNAANVLYLPKGTVQPFNSYVPEFEERSAHTAYVSGVAPSFKGATGVVQPGSIPLSHLDVASVVLTPGSEAGLPPQYPWWIFMGCAVTYANNADYAGLLPTGYAVAAGNNDEIITIRPDPYHTRANSSVRFQYNMLQEGRAEAMLHDCIGSRGGGSLTLGDGEPWMLEPQGVCLGAKPTKNASPATTTTIEEEPLMGRGAVYALTEVDTPTTYAGGTETAPDMDACITNKVLTINTAPYMRKCSGGTYGYGTARWNPTPDTFAFDLDAVTWPDDFDIYTMMEERRMLRYTEVIPKPGSAVVSFARFRFNGFITGFEPAGENDIRTGRVTLTGAFPESGGDGGGLAPALGAWEVQHVTLVAAP
ncbi:MAG: hypothetical protein GY778_16050 [bacterium]|nr:hypothetical protein [bacterium]